MYPTPCRRQPDRWRRDEYSLPIPWRMGAAVIGNVLIRQAVALDSDQRDLNSIGMVKAARNGTPLFRRGAAYQPALAGRSGAVGPAPGSPLFFFGTFATFRR